MSHAAHEVHDLRHELQFFSPGERSRIAGERQAESQGLSRPVPINLPNGPVPNGGPYIMTAFFLLRKSI